MDIQSFREYCLALPHTTEDFPFDENVLVFRIGGKIYALCDIEEFSGVNLKCNPERAVELREQHDGIIAGYHMSKKHWNTVDTTGLVPTPLLLELTRHSYDLVKASLPKKLREQLG